MNLNVAVLLVLLCLFIGGCSSRYTAYQEGADGQLLINEYEISIKDIPSFEFVYFRDSIEASDLKSRSKGLAKKVFIAANMQGLEIMGPLTMTLGDLRYLAGGPLEVSLGFPATGEFVPRSGVQLETLTGFTCITVSLPLDVLDIETYWAALIRATYRFGYKPSGEFRTVMKFNDTNTGYLMELQVGV